MKCNTGLKWVKSVQGYMQLADLFEYIFSLKLNYYSVSFSFRGTDT